MKLKTHQADVPDSATILHVMLHTAVLMIPLIISKNLSATVFSSFSDACPEFFGS